MREMGVTLPLAARLARTLPRGKGAVVRALGKRLYRPNSRYITTRHGAKLVMSPDSLDVYASMYADDRAWDYNDMLLCLAGTVDGGVLYDVGSNIGYFAIEVAQITRGKAGVVAFEAQSSLADAITASTALGPHTAAVQVIDALVGDKDGPATLYLAPATIHASAVADSNRPVRATVEKRMITIDRLVADGEIPPPTMVKMDIEGSEHLALRGAARTLREHRPHIALEFHTRDDPGGRIWAELQRLADDTGCYDFFFGAHVHKRASMPARLNPLKVIGSLDDVDTVFMRNRERSVRDETPFAERQ